MSPPNWHRARTIKRKGKRLIELPPDIDPADGPDSDLHVRLERLERDREENRRQTEQRIILAELKVEAMRANMIDLDGLQFLDMKEICLGEDGGIVGGAEVIGRLKHVKPWLFSGSSSSSIAKVPPSSPTRQKLVKDMSEEEYRIARANLIKRSAF